MDIIYDNQFNANEWYVIVLTIIGYLLFFKVKKRFNWVTSAAFLMLGIFGGHFFDHTISLPPFDYYDVNDSNAYEWVDFLSYVMFGPFSYFFLYLFDKYIVGTRYTTLYIGIWAFVAIGFEYIGHILGVYHYKNGYEFVYSLSIYLLFLSVLLSVYYLIKNNDGLSNKKEISN